MCQHALRLSLTSQILTPLLALSHHQDLTTQGPRGLGLEPCFDAGDMEGMAALGLQLELVHIHEVSQAYGALSYNQLWVLGTVRV